ncbi:hypothetical protein ACFL3P_05650 [Pseudomonadota bacterium]
MITTNFLDKAVRDATNTAIPVVTARDLSYQTRYYLHETLK